MRTDSASLLAQIHQVSNYLTRLCKELGCFSLPKGHLWRRRDPRTPPQPLKRWKVSPGDMTSAKSWLMTGNEDECSQSSIYLLLVNSPRACFYVRAALKMVGCAPPVPAAVEDQKLIFPEWFLFLLLNFKESLLNN